MSVSAGSILDPKVKAVIDRMVALPRTPPSDNGPRKPPTIYSEAQDPFEFAQWGYSVKPYQGEILYFMCRAMRATRIAEFATSVGLSTIYFAAAMRDNGGGKVIGSELVPSKVATARKNIADAGLSDYVEIREGDARETLRDLGGPVDFALIDGWPIAGNQGTLAYQVMKIVAPQMRIGAMAMNDNNEIDYHEFVRNPANGFLSLKLPDERSTELSVKIR